jgi:MoaA/NifB/PqqE/SkfB family radical SAM enzyme
MTKVLSIHAVDECCMSPRCSFCYMSKITKTLPLDFFYTIPKVAKEIGIEQIAIGGGELLQPQYVEFLNKFTSICCDYNIIPNMTTNAMRVKEVIPDKYSIPDFIENLGAISVSFDEYKVHTIGLNNYVSNIMHLREMVDASKDTEWANPKIGMNYLLMDKKHLSMLPQTINYFKDYIDTFYILQIKNKKLEYTIEDLKKVLYPLTLLLKDRLCVDDSILLRLGKKEYCHYGQEMISLSYDGGVRGCSFNNPIGYVTKASDLKDIIASNYPLKKCTKCDYLWTD